MDDQIRRLERQAQTGNYHDWVAWKTALNRAGLPDPDLEEIRARLTHEEEIQQDYDETWWHAKERLRFGWDWEPRGGLVKAHHIGGRHRQDGVNSKRKTLRTHRNGSRRCYKLKRNRTEDKAPPSGAAQEAARRRKKRFGGREHRQWIARGHFGPWIFEVDLGA